MVTLDQGKKKQDRKKKENTPELEFRYARGPANRLGLCAAGTNLAVSQGARNIGCTAIGLYIIYQPCPSRTSLMPRVAWPSRPQQKHALFVLAHSGVACCASFRLPNRALTTLTPSAQFSAEFCFCGVVRTARFNRYSLPFVPNSV